MDPYYPMEEAQINIIATIINIVFYSIIAVIIIFCINMNKKNKEKRQKGEISEKNWLTTLLLCLFTGILGIHRFYVGKIGTGLLYLFTLGCFGIGTITDFISICIGAFTDVNNNLIINDSSTKKENSSIGKAEELKKYKELLDSGVITEAEFETKKKQLLNL